MAHCNTILSQILKLVPRHEFETLAKQHHSGRSFRKASRWSQFVSLTMAQLSGRNSLRDIVDNMSAQMHRLYHLGSAKLSRSNLSRINEDKPYALYEALFGKLLTRCQGVAPDHSFRFTHPLYSLDASTIDLCLSAFPWADFRTTKGAIKLHVGLNHAGYLPEFVVVTEGKKHDVTVGRTLIFPKGSIIAIDKAYNDYVWYKQLTDKGIFFVTRLFSASMSEKGCRSPRNLLVYKAYHNFIWNRYMGIDIQRDILGLKGQCVNRIKLDEEEGQLVIGCRRDRRRKAIDPVTEQQGTVNRYVRRQVRDVPLFGYPCVIEMELAQVCISKNERRIESCEFVDTGWRFTRRCCRMISGLCRHMSIQAVSRHLGIRWETVKKIDKAYREESLPALDPTLLTGLKYLGVDEVARAKGHDYMTVIYDMVEGHLIGVETGRTADVFSAFLKQLPAETTANIEAVAMDMGPSYQKSVRDCLPNADIVFDRFHVMKNYSKALSNQRRIEFRKANKEGKKLLTGTHYLVLKNADKLNESQAQKLHRLLDENANLNTLYILKEQLQALWESKTVELMQERLEAWCRIADQSTLLYLKKFAKSLRNHRVGICNYAKHKLTSARIEAGNIGIGMIRKRARGIRDTEYFKLKIRQSSLPDNDSMFYVAA